MLAKAVSEIAVEKFPGCKVEFFVYPSVGKHGTYPGKAVEDKMKAADVVARAPGTVINRRTSSSTRLNA